MGAIDRVECSNAPKAIGPYSQAVAAGDFVFVSGQIPVSVETGEVAGNGIKEQTHLVIDNTEKILSSCGLGLGNIVKADVFLKDLEDFSDMNDVYGTRFGGDVRPARCVIQAAKLPKDVKIELSCIAYRV